MNTQLPHDQEVLVSPMYLAGSNGTGDAGFAPVAHWPHHYLDDGPCQLLVTSPDQRIRVGWFGDDFELWKITAAEDAVSAPRWTATFNHVTPAEIVAGVTSALARDYAEGDARFLARPSLYWADAVQPLTDAGWRHVAAERGLVEIVAPDGQAGVLIDNRLSGWTEESVTLWAGPPGWGTRAEAVFSLGTPSHLIAATAAAMTDPTPVVRERHQLHRAVENLVTLTPVELTTPQTRPTPTPLNVRRTGVTQAVERASRFPRTAVDLPCDGGPQPHGSSGAEPDQHSQLRSRRQGTWQPNRPTPQPLTSGARSAGPASSPTPGSSVMPDATALDQATTMIEKAWGHPIEALETLAVRHPCEDPLLRAAMRIRSSLVIIDNTVAVHQDRLHALTRPGQVPAFYDLERITSSAVELRVAQAECRTAVQAIGHVIAAHAAAVTAERPPAPRLAHAAVARSGHAPRGLGPAPDQPAPSAAISPTRAMSSPHR